VKTSLWKHKGAIPYLLALFLNAFTDLGHKIIIQNTVFKIYDGHEQIVLTSILNALILLPFIFLLTPAGYISQRFSKAQVMQYGAFAAIVITFGITLSYYQGWFWCAFALTFMLAAQSALYSPAKYGYITELVSVDRISGLNAVVQSVTTVAILSGIMVYTFFFETSLREHYETQSDILQQIAPLGWLLVAGSAVEYLLTLRLMHKYPVGSQPFDLKRYLSGSYFRQNWNSIRSNKNIFEAIILLSLFWSISQVILSTFGAYAKSTLHEENTIVVQGLMALAAFGIILGSFFASNISKYYLHRGLIPLGSMILTLSLFALPLTHSLILIGVIFFIFGIGGAMMIVSLNALIQSHAGQKELGFILAGNNWVQNVFMTAFLSFTTFFAMMGYESIPIFWMMFVISLMSTIWLILRYGDYLLWLFFENMLAMRYDIIPIGLHHIPRDGSVLLLGNHISWIDWVLVQIGVERRIGYMMERSIYDKKLIRPIMKLGRVIPVSSTAAKDAFRSAKKRLNNDEIIGVFPEGGISHDGEIGKIYPGFQIIAQGIEGVIIPFYIDGMYGSIFSRASKRHIPMTHWLRRRVRIIYGSPLSIDSDAKTLHEAIIQLKETYGSQ
jgi:acyl-[acyl-carrier-protein]-phospholipid O-acyltransferase/long-chain-fatty-acid--[acyl-carrier-protein] ligase